MGRGNRKYKKFTIFVRNSIWGWDYPWEKYSEGTAKVKKETKIADGESPAVSKMKSQSKILKNFDSFTCNNTLQFQGHSCNYNTIKCNGSGLLMR